MSDSAPPAADGGDDFSSRDAAPPRREPLSPARARTYLPAEEGRKAGSLAIVWERLEATEELLATMGAGLSVTQALMTRFSVTRRQARALQAAVRMRWHRESHGDEGRAQRVERYRRTLEQVVKQGFERKRTAFSGDGEQHEYADPDLKAVTAATALLLRMDGADQPSEPSPLLPPGETPATDGAVQVVDRNDMVGELRARRAKPA